jgi:hypothetical protein
MYFVVVWWQTKCFNPHPITQIYTFQDKKICKLTSQLIRPKSTQFYHCKFFFLYQMEIALRLAHFFLFISLLVKAGFSQFCLFIVATSLDVWDVNFTVIYITIKKYLSHIIFVCYCIRNVMVILFSNNLDNWHRSVLHILGNELFFAMNFEWQFTLVEPI